MKTVVRQALSIVLVAIGQFAYQGSAQVISGFTSGIISFDYSQSELGYLPYGPGPGAIGNARDLWNSRSIVDYTPLQLVKTDGTPTSVIWSVIGGGGNGSPNIGGTYARLFDMNMAFGIVGPATLTGLTPNQNYSLYLYSVHEFQTLSINGVNFSSPPVDIGGVNSLTSGVQYAVHTVTADGNGTLSFVPVSTQNGTPYISSWQLTPIPEPACLSLAGLGFCLLAARRPILRY